MKSAIKKHIKISVLLLVGLSFLLSSSGLFILLHHCNSEHHTYSFFMQTAVDCNDHHQDKNTRSKSDTPDFQGYNFDAPACCEENSFFLKLSADFIDSKLNSQITQILACTNVVIDFSQLFSLRAKESCIKINTFSPYYLGLPIFIKISQFLL